ncbi:MAG: DUF3786 domain-containing protein [Dehalococcoidia bacterium]|nr:DUF3786 domain-containing protein [Dehalococcoidia bacterium]
MGFRDKKLLSLKEIEGPTSPHDGFLKREMDRRKEPLSYVDKVSKLAEYIGGEVVSLGISEDWAIRKEIFPGIQILLIYNRADEEFPSNLRVLYSGERIGKIRGEDLVELTIACVNHTLRYVRETVKDPPEICMRV